MQPALKAIGDLCSTSEVGGSTKTVWNSSADLFPIFSIIDISMDSRVFYTLGYNPILFYIVALTFQRHCGNLFLTFI